MSEQQIKYFIGQLQARCNDIYKDIVLLKEKLKIDKKEEELENDFSCGEALKRISSGSLRVSRRCWNNKNIYIYVFKPTENERENFIVVRTKSGFNVPWCPNHNDLLAHDWYLIEDKRGSNDVETV